jgi:NAD(P)-dependent dehydrogenase (short-subunit alcohol dehydrogenase family)
LSLRNKNIICFTADNEISSTIVSAILEDQPAHLSIIGSSVLNVSDHSNVHHYAPTEEDTIEKILTEKLPQEIAFNGLVFGWGKGGVRPAKMNSASFVRDMFEQNVFSFLEISRILLKKRRLSEGGSIVVLSSVSSMKGLKSKSVYSASKAALDAAVRGLAAELSTKKIRVNSIRKGWVSSDMNLSFIESNRSISAEDDLNRQLLGPIHPEEIAHLVTFLLSDKLKTLTGQSLVVDGGYTL